jgi:hypothetical protein
MTPKEKAGELVDKIQEGLWRDRAVRIYQEDAVYTALIAVDEIIGQWEIIDVYLANGNGQLNQNLEYWYKVKQEINGI